MLIDNILRQETLHTINSQESLSGKKISKGGHRDKGPIPY